MDIKTNTCLSRFDNEKASKYLLITFIIIINLIILYNTLFHFPFRGYDSYYHRLNIQIYPTSIPTPEESKEFFSAPLPYFIPSIVNRVCNSLGVEPNLSIRLAGKASQLINFLFSVGISFLFWKITDKINPGNLKVKWIVYLNLGILTVFYRTFSQVRGEPYLTFFSVLLFYLVIKFLVAFWNGTVKYQNGIVFGIILGLALLSRQWAFFLIPAFFIVFLLAFKINKSIRNRLWKFLLAATLSTMLISGWFYLFLNFKYGSITAFNLETQGFSLSTLPYHFFRATGLGNFILFTNPVRPTFDFTFFPIMYSDTWGDYWAYFSVDLDSNNADVMRSYLGFINLIAVLPTFLIIVSFFGIVSEIFNNWKHNLNTPENSFKLLLILVFFFTMVGFLWFVISYPETTNGDTVKATYVIQALIALPLITGFYWGNKLKQKKVLFIVFAIFYLIVFSLSFKAYLTTYVIPLVPI